MHRAFIMLLLLTVCAPNVFAWGQDGHRIVCRIAYQALSADDQKEVDRLAKAYKTPPDTELKIDGFPDACVFPDEARSKARAAMTAHSTTSPWLHFKGFNNWHFLNVQRSVRAIPQSACANDCVLTGIARHAAMLKSGATDQERGEGLIFLAHWIGDVHQPLHVSYADDQGGNMIQPITGGFFPIPEKFPLNLHAVWDTSIIAAAETDWSAYADELEAKITDAQKAKWLKSTPLKWAQESYEITTLTDVEYCQNTSTGCQSLGSSRELTKDYQDEFVDDVELRLQKAGIRLANAIRKALHP